MNIFMWFVFFMLAPVTLGASCLSGVTLIHPDGKFTDLTVQDQLVVNDSGTHSTYYLENASEPRVRATLSLKSFDNHCRQMTLQIEKTKVLGVRLKLKPSLRQPATLFLIKEEAFTFVDDIPKACSNFELAGLTTKLEAFAVRPIDTQAFLIEASAVTMEVEFSSSKESSLFICDLYLGPKDLAAIRDFDPKLDRLFYSGLWGWLRFACFSMSYVMNTLYLLFNNWPLTILVLALLVRCLIYPAAAYGLRVKEKHRANMAKIKPELEEAKAALKGRKLHEKMVKIYEENGMSPLDGMKGLLSLFLQIPFFIIIYAVISEEVRLSQVNFLWINDFTQPDRLLTTSLSLPFFGSDFNLFPILMGLITIVSSRLQADCPSERKSLYAMAVLFTVLFYHFPSGIVMYWILSNALQLLHQWIKKY